MDPLLGLRGPGERRPYLRPAAPGIIRRRSRPPLLLLPKDAVSAGNFGEVPGGGVYRQSQNGTPTFSLTGNPETMIPSAMNRFPQFAPVAYGFAARYANGTDADGSTNYSAEALSVAFTFPGALGVTGFDVAISTVANNRVRDMPYALGKRAGVLASQADLDLRALPRPADGEWVATVLECHPGGTSSAGPNPALFVQLSGSSTSGISERFVIHFFRLYYD